MVERTIPASIVSSSVVNSKINFSNNKTNTEIENIDLLEADNYQNVSNEQLQDVIKK